MIRHRIVYGALALLTIAAGLIWRLAPLGLPPLLYKYGGSILWAVMVYWLFAMLTPRTRPLHLALVAGLFACCVELFRLIHTPALDAFRLTLAGRLLLGRVFSRTDIAVYWLAIAATAIADAQLRNKGMERNETSL
jgi:hypothetical protein